MVVQDTEAVESRQVKGGEISNSIKSSLKEGLKKFIENWRMGSLPD